MAQYKLPAMAAATALLLLSSEEELDASPGLGHAQASLLKPVPGSKG